MNQVELSYILWALDPIGTCCNKNSGMEDEYYSEAEGILQLVKSGVPFKYAYIISITDSFWYEKAVSSLSMKLIETYYNAL